MDNQKLKQNAEEQIACNLCGGARHTLYQTAEPPFRVLKCNTCGLVFVHPQPENVQTAYEDEYYRPWLESQTQPRLKMWSRRLRDVENAQHARGRILDVGCGIPHFLSLARGNGWDISGTEISKFACRYAAEEMSIEVFHGPLENARFADNSFDVVTIWHVLEHVPDPIATFREIHRILRPSGLLVAAVPNLDNHFMRVAYRLIKGHPEQLFSTADREIHLYHFSPETLRKLTETAGFSVIKVTPDRGEVMPAKQLIDAAPSLLNRITGLNYTNTIRIYARKK